MGWEEMDEMKPLNMKDIAIIDAFPVYDCLERVLNVGCGEGRLDYHLQEMGYRVHATDIHWPKNPKQWEGLTFHCSDIFDLSSFPIKSSPIVICSQVLEHLSGYKLALVHLLALTEVRLIITVPHKLSFRSPDHINFWDDQLSSPAISWQQFKDIHEFIDLCAPYSTTISKIRTKPEDAGDTYNYLIVVDKRQNI
jgi:SAM-dependent methyltransferase